MADDLPTEFDVIVVGTGMPESIVAAACARIGQSVLHIDRNEYYSGQWASFNLEGFEKWKSQTEAGDTLTRPSVDEASLLQDGERLVQLPLTDTSYKDIDIKYHVSDPEPEVTTVESESQQNDEQSNKDKSDTSTVVAQTCGAQESSGAENADPKQDKDLQSENKDKQEDSSHDSNTLDSKQSETPQSQTETGKQAIQSETPQSQTETGKQAATEEKEEASQHEKVQEAVESKEKKTEENPTPEKCPTWTKSKIKKEWRRFNLDLSPRMLYCGGKMVELLITSDIAKYCEFKTVSRMLTILNGKLEMVPCSRADVFSSKKVSMLEKRMLMKFLTFCAEYEKHPEDFQDFTEKPFIEYLRHKKLTSNLLHFVQHSIAMVTNQTTTLEGLKMTQKFLRSLGRYGNTAFLWPLYGSGEMPQGFCRMCAVFGGIYCLRMSASSLIMDKDNRCKGIILTDGKRISSKWVIMEQTYAPEQYLNASDQGSISRSVLLTDKSLMPTSDPHQLSLLRIPDPEDELHPTTVLELPPSSMACPKNMYVIHITKESQNDSRTAEENLSNTVKTLFKNTDDDSEEDKPSILWSLYFQQKNNSRMESSTEKPENVFLLPGPGAEIDMDHTVKQARDIFEHLNPGEDFLPRPPNPEDIIYVDDEEAAVSQSANQSDFQESGEKTDQSEAPSIQIDQSKVPSQTSASEVSTSTNEQESPNSPEKEKSDESQNSKSSENELRENSS